VRRLREAEAIDFHHGSSSNWRVEYAHGVLASEGWSL